MPKETFNIINFGCRATQADGAAIEQAFLNHRLGKAEAWQNSDVVVINTCTVTHSADTQARQVIRKVHRENPKAKIVVTGCYAQRAPQEVARIEGVTCVMGNSYKEQLVPIVMKKYFAQPELPTQQYLSGGTCQQGNSLSDGELSTINGARSGVDVFCSSIFESRTLRSIADMSGAGRTRPVLKVQDGCSLRCSYCVIPYVRGNSRSLQEEEVLRQVEHLLDQGFKEIVFTGIHLGAYGRDFENKKTLAALIKRVLQQERLARLRLSSIEPLEVTDEIIGLVAESPKMAKHFHVPLQSGSDRLLRLMRRPYSSDYYARLVEKLRQSVPDTAIGADVMVGFPTETEADHARSKDLLKSAPVTYLHVFPYSPRPGTPSAQLRPEVPGRAAQRRSLELRELGAEKNLQFRTSFLSKRLSVITLDGKEDGEKTQALSTNYLKVELEAKVKPNQLLEVLVKGMTTEGVRAEREE
jgi:threonylcarbamoyladenosine tRNA methylthiotransferase MtaB